MLAGQSVSLEEQLAQWEERKAAEKLAKARNSCMDDVPTGQPALALAQKIVERATGAGLPEDLVPTDLREIRIDIGGDPENELRAAVLEFIDTVRAAERAVLADRRGDGIADATLAAITADEWRAHWPSTE